MTALSGVDQQLRGLLLLLSLVALAILVFVIYSGLYFVKSIVLPVGEVTKTAKRIASGDYTVRLEKKNDDEIGDLCDTRCV